MIKNYIKKLLVLPQS